MKIQFSNKNKLEILTPGQQWLWYL